VCILEIFVGKIWVNAVNYKGSRIEVLNSLSKIKNTEIKNYIKLGLSENIKRPHIKNISTDFILLLHSLV
jgi:hypothetical protein